MEHSPLLWQPPRRESESESTLPHLWKPEQKSTSKQLSSWQPVRRSTPRQSSQPWHPFQRAMPIRLSPTRKPVHQNTPTPNKTMKEVNIEVASPVKTTTQDYKTTLESRSTSVHFQSLEEAEQCLQYGHFQKALNSRKQPQKTIATT